MLEAVTEVEIQGSLPKDTRCSIKVSELNSALKRKDLFCQQRCFNCQNKLRARSLTLLPWAALQSHRSPSGGVAVAAEP